MTVKDYIQYQTKKQPKYVTFPPPERHMWCIIDKCRIYLSKFY